MTQSPSDRRIHPRTAAHVPLWVNHMREDLSVHERCLLSRDISQTGVFVETGRSWPVGSTVLVEQVFGAAFEEILLPDWVDQGRFGTVVRSTPEGMGVHLNPLESKK